MPSEAYRLQGGTVPNPRGILPICGVMHRARYEMAEIKAHLGGSWGKCLGVGVEANKN